jgi:hypothetical protein
MEKNKFQELMKNLEENKGAIILEKARVEKRKIDKRKKYAKKIKIDVDIFDDRVEYFIGNTIFTFDREGYDLFEAKFDTFRSKIIVYKGEETSSEGYLCRLLPGLKKPLSFHRWLMLKEIEKFAKENDIEDLRTIHVHHKDLDTTNNRKNNLQVMTKEAHRKLHNELNR